MFDLKYQQLISPWNGVSVGFNMVAIQMETIWHLTVILVLPNFVPTILLLHLLQNTQRRLNKEKHGYEMVDICFFSYIEGSG